MKLVDSPESENIGKQLLKHRYPNYSSYLQSERWKSFKAWFLSRVINKNCAACDGINPDLHHKTYRRLGEELATDVVLLCRKCHLQVHLLAFTLGKGMLREATDSYIEVIHARTRSARANRTQSSGPGAYHSRIPPKTKRLLIEEAKTRLAIVR